MRLTDEHVELMVDEAQKVARDTQVNPNGAHRPDVLLTCENVKTLAKAYESLIRDSGILLSSHDRLEAVLAAAVKVANTATEMTYGSDGYATGIFSGHVIDDAVLAELKEAIGG